MIFQALSTPDAAWTFLPADPAEDRTSPSLQRDGQTIPLRPEMLQLPNERPEVPVLKERRLPNGLRWFFREDRTLPRVDAVIMLRAGSIADPENLEGLAEWTGESLRAGGTKTLNPEEFDRQLESLGSSLGVGVSRDAARLQLFSLSAYAATSIELMADLVRNPRFDPVSAQVRLGLLRDGILRQDDDPTEVARRTFRRTLYGGSHPLARTATTESLTRLTTDQLQAFHNTWYRPDLAFLGITGDISEEEAQQLVEKHFGNWTAQSQTPWPIPPTQKDWDTTSGVVLLPKRIQQTQIRIGHMGLPRQHPNRYAVTLMNNVLGTGGFSSRLMDRVRSKKGLAYGAGGSITSDEPVGLFATGAATQARTTLAAVREILAIIRETATGDITKEELDLARRDVVHSFLNGFGTPTAILDASLNAAFLNEEPDFLSRFVERIEAVTLEEVNQAARTHLHPDRLKIVLVGFEAAFEKTLDEFGPVTRLETDGTLAPPARQPLPEARGPFLHEFHPHP